MKSDVCVNGRLFFFQLGMQKGVSWVSISVFVFFVF